MACKVLYTTCGCLTSPKLVINSENAIPFRRKMCYDNVDWISRVRFIVRPMPHNSVKTADFSYFVGLALAKVRQSLI